MGWVGEALLGPFVAWHESWDTGTDYAELDFESRRGRLLSEEELG